MKDEKPQQLEMVLSFDFIEHERLTRKLQMQYLTWMRRPKHRYPGFLREMWKTIRKLRALTDY